MVNSSLWVGCIPHIMNIFFYHKQNPSTNINQDAFDYNKLYVDNMFANITFASSRFPDSKIFLIEEGLNTSSLNLPNLTVIKQHKNLSTRHRDFFKNYFHSSDENQELILIQLERYFYIYESLVNHGIKNFVNLDSDCVILEDLSAHDFEKIGIVYPPFSEECVASPLMSSTANLDKFLDFTCSFYEGVQQQKNKIEYIGSFFNKARKQVSDMTLWYLFKEENPNLFINNLSLDSDDSIHDLGLGTGNWCYDNPRSPLNNLNNGNYNFTTHPAQKHNPQGVLETAHIKQIFYTEDGPCFEEKDTKKLIKIKSLHFSPGTLKFDIIPFIKEYKTIYGLPH